MTTPNSIKLELPYYEASPDAYTKGLQLAQAALSPASLLAMGCPLPVRGGSSSLWDQTPFRDVCDECEAEGDYPVWRVPHDSQDFSWMAGGTVCKKCALECGMW